MNTTSTKPFGRRGAAPASAPRAPVTASTSASPQRLAAPTVDVSPELVAAILRPQGEDAPLMVRNAEIVPRSYRAAILAGLIVAILNAAVNVTFATKATEGLGLFSLGEAKVPVAAALIMAALWSAAQSSVMCLLVAHRLLVRMERTSYIAYVIAGGGAALALALGMQLLLGQPPGPGGFGMTLVSGLATGLFYRMFAGTRLKDA